MLKIFRRSAPRQLWIESPKPAGYQVYLVNVSESGSKTCIQTFLNKKLDFQHTFQNIAQLGT